MNAPPLPSRPVSSHPHWTIPVSREFTGLPNAQDTGGENPYIDTQGCFKASDRGRLGRQAASHPWSALRVVKSCRKDACWLPALGCLPTYVGYVHTMRIHLSMLGAESTPPQYQLIGTMSPIGVDMLAIRTQDCIPSDSLLGCSTALFSRRCKIFVGWTSSSTSYRFCGDYGAWQGSKWSSARPEARGGGAGR